MSEQLQTGQTGKVEGLTPAEIVSELDNYIVGQSQAKKAVAIALRNRARRRALGDDLREEVQPKNIIMIGSTGVGKTEIARRLSRLAQAPFIKVEATKYTEVGYVGRDVESMVRDLVTISIKMEKELMRASVEEKARANADERILDILLPRSPASGGMPSAGAESSALGRAIDAENERAAKNAETRQLFKKKLDDGKLNDKEIEVDQGSNQNPMMGILAPGSGMEDMEMNLQNMLSDFMPRKKKKRRVSVEEARKIFIEEEVEKMLDTDRLQQNAVKRVEEMGIIFLDEIDKVTSRSDGQRSGEVSREGVQRDLLPIVEGASVNTKYGPVQTDHILFIAAGAFHGSKVSDLIPELQGRFPIRVELESLTENDFRTILTQPNNALTKQYEALLSTEGLSVSFTDDGINEIARLAHFVNSENENIGARRLHTILEKIFEEVSFNAPELALTAPKVVIDKSYVHERLGELTEKQDLSKFIL